jgi:DNA-binding LacI/PurR family transcriptional regulator
MGEQAASLLIQKLRNPDEPLAEKTELPHQLIVRTSSQKSITHP